MSSLESVVVVATAAMIYIICFSASAITGRLSTVNFFPLSRCSNDALYSVLILYNYGPQIHLLIDGIVAIGVVRRRKAVLRCCSGIAGCRELPNIWSRSDTPSGIQQGLFTKVSSDTPLKSQTSKSKLRESFVSKKFTLEAIV